MTTYYLDTNSGFFYKKIIAVLANSEDTCSIEGWSSTFNYRGSANTTGTTSPTITIEGRGYDVSKVTSISKTNFIQSNDVVKTTGGTVIFPSQYEIRSFTGANFTIPRHVNTIAQDAFSACTNLTSIIYSGRLGNNAFGTTVNSPLIQYAEPGKTTFVKYFHRGSTETSYTIPSGITTINASAFDEPLLTSIIYLGDLTGKVSTTGTSPLIQQYTNPENKIIIKKYFQRSSSETTFKSGDYPTVNIISEKAFIDNDKLYKIIINSNVIITQNAFFNCLNLKGIVISSPCTLQNSIISSTSTKLDYVLISSTIPVTMDTTNASPIFPSSILAATNYCVVSKENSAAVNTLFGTSNTVYIEDATNPPAADTGTRVYIRPVTYNSIKTALVGESNDINSVSSSIEFDTKVDIDNAKASADAETARTAAEKAESDARIAAEKADSDARIAALTASAQLNSANANTSEREAKLLRAIQDKVRAINAAITDITGEQAINNRKINYFGQDKYVNMYVNRIGLILYYIVFILLALSFYYNRESYSIVMIVISLIVFALLPFVIKYITRFAYEQFLGLLKVFYKGNALYL